MLTDKDANKAYRAGFTHEEVAELQSSREQVNIDSPAWRDALTRRKKYSRDVRTSYLKDVGATLGREAYDRQVNQRRKKNSPWAWLKIAYLPKKKIDFLRASKRRAMKDTLPMRKLTRR